MGGNVIDYPSPAASGPGSAATGHRLGRWSVVCVGVLVISFLFLPLVPVVLITGLGFGLAAIILTRGRSVAGWTGLILHASLTGLFIWAFVKWFT